MPEALLEALKRGHYCSSIGPDISEMSWHDSHVEVARSDAVTVTLIGVGSAATVVHGEGMTRTTLPFGAAPRAPGCASRVTDAAGGRASTNPLRR